MIKHSILIAFTWLFSLTLCAQTSDYYSLKDVKNYRFDHLQLNASKDIDQFVQNAAQYTFIEALKIKSADPSDLRKVLKAGDIAAYIKELDLLEFSGHYTDSSFDSTCNIETLHIRINEEHLNELMYLRALKHLETVYLYIDGKPDGMQALAYLPSLKELHIIGEFLPKDLKQVCLYIKEQTRLQILGISVDRITDVPKELIKLKTLSKLYLYDNLSVYTNKGIEDLDDQSFTMSYVVYDDEVRAINIHYCSNTGELAEFELAHLQGLYQGEVVANAYEETSVELSKAPVIPFKTAFQPDFPHTAEFNPLYPRIAPNTEYFSVSNQKPSVLYSNSGMTITIPENCFEQTDGSPVEGTVYLRLIQIKDVSDVLFAGLNLKNGFTQLSNQYLFNLQATGEKQAVKLKDGYLIKVDMPCSKDSAQSYFFDYESNSWQDLDLYNQVFASTFEPLDFYKIQHALNLQSRYQFDTTLFNERFYSAKHFVLNDAQISSQMVYKRNGLYVDLDRTWNKEFNQDGHLKGVKIKRGKTYIKIQKVIPKERNIERQYFKLLDKTEQGIFTELKALKAINFNTVIDPEQKKAFQENFIKNTKYFDVKVMYLAGKDYCEIVLKTNDGYRKIKAFISDVSDDKANKKQILKFMKAYKQYNALRYKREQSFNQNNQIRFSEFKTYISDKQNAIAKAKGQKKADAFTEIKMHQLGTFGVLYTREASFSTNIIAQYTDESGLPIDVKALFMIDKRFNTLFNVQVGNIAFEPDQLSALIAIDYSGNLYYANKNDVPASQLSNNSLTYIKLKKLPQNIQQISGFNQAIKH
jgi:hypothetical protein